LLPQTLGFYLTARGVGDGVAAQSWPKRTKSFQQIAWGGIDPCQKPDQAGPLWKGKGVQACRLGRSIRKYFKTNLPSRPFRGAPQSKHVFSRPVVRPWRGGLISYFAPQLEQWNSLEGGIPFRMHSDHLRLRKGGAGLYTVPKAVNRHCGTLLRGRSAFRSVRHQILPRQIAAPSCAKCYVKAVRKLAKELEAQNAEQTAGARPTDQ
jgi:hypothetical protein